MIGVLCLAVLAIFIANGCIDNSAGLDAATRSVVAPILIVMFGVEGFLLFCYNDAMERECDWERPFAYRFFQVN